MEKNKLLENSQKFLKAKLDLANARNENKALDVARREFFVTLPEGDRMKTVSELYATNGFQFGTVTSALTKLLTSEDENMVFKALELVNKIFGVQENIIVNNNNTFTSNTQNNVGVNAILDKIKSTRLE